MEEQLAKEKVLDFLNALKPAALAARSPAERQQVLRAAAQALDPQALGQHVNAFSLALMKIYRENPDLMEELKPAVAAAVAAADFGKLREGLTALSHYGTELSMAGAGAVIKNPAVSANLAGILAPSVNNLLRLLNQALAEAELPPEILASALFNILSDLDRQELGRLVNAAAKTVNQLHEGNLVLGGDEPFFRGVFTKLAGGVLEQLDPEAVAGAAVALAEDTELMFAVASDLILRKPEFLIPVFSAVLSLETILIRSAADLESKISQLPEATLIEISEEMLTNFEGQPIGQLLNSTLVAFNRVMELNPELYLKLCKDALAAIDPAELRQAFFRSLLLAADAAKTDASMQKLFEPEAVGESLNELVAGFNRYAEANPEAMPEYFRRVLAELEPPELTRATQSLVSGMNEAMIANPERVLALARPMLAGGWRMFRFLVGSWVKRIFSGTINRGK